MRIKGRKYIAPHAVRFVDLIRIIVRRFNEDRCMQIAASLTFTSLLAIVPVVTIAVTVISAFPVFAGVTAALHNFILQNLVPASVESVASYTQQFSLNAAKLTAVGIGFLAVTSILLLLTIERAFNDIWRVKRSRSVVQRIFIYWTLITVGPVSIGASLTLTSWFVGQAIGLVEGLPGAGVLVWNVVPIALTSLALTLLYIAMPNRRIAPRDAMIGGVLAGLVFEAMKRGFGFYVASFPTYTLVYGAFATLPVFLLWIYLSWLVVIGGAVVVAALPEWRLAAGQRTPAPGSDFFDALQILKILWRGHLAGTRVKLAELLGAATVRIENVERILDTMAAVGWVRRTVPSGWVLHRDIETITVEDVFGLFTFRSSAHRPGREADPALEKLALEIGARLSESMHISLAALFRSAEQQDTPVIAREEVIAQPTSP
ncbi:MAG TPA: YihY family inner membrane protein [Burkholderiales bacterium]|nr:YihY family inner membrane protein [Burkholderiales bacterium]